MAAAAAAPPPQDDSMTLAVAASLPLGGAFAALHDIELQLVLRFLDVRSLLRTARCCRRTLHEARRAFVWEPHRDSPFRVRGDSVSRVGASLLQHRVPLAVHMTVWEPSAVASQLETLTTTEHLQRFEVTLHPRPRVAGTLSSFLAFFTQPTIRENLRHVTIIEKSEAAMAHTLCHGLRDLPNLEGLDVQSNSRNIALQLGICISKLRLKRLSVWISFSTLEHTWLNSIMRSATLSLTLQYLSLRRVNFTLVDTYPFSLLASLECVHFDVCNRVHAVIEELSRLPSLKSILFTQYSLNALWQHGPSVEVMRKLQERCEHLESMGLRLTDVEGAPKINTLRMSLLAAQLRVPVEVRRHKDPAYE